MSNFNFLCANFQKFETFIRALEVEGGSAGSSRCSSACATCGGSGSVSTRTRSSSARCSTATAPVVFPANWRPASSAATSALRVPRRLGESQRCGVVMGADAAIRRGCPPTPPSCPVTHCPGRSCSIRTLITQPRCGRRSSAPHVLSN